MKLKKGKILGIILILIGIVTIILFQLFAPYCAKNICGCTGMGEQWSIIQPLGIVSILIGGICLI